jgi:diacylglycerol kinase family enzyme
MYYYIVDTGKITQRQFERVQSNLYSSISDYHINGEIVRVTGIRTIHQLVETAFFHQAKTIVAVGADETLNQVINYVGARTMTVGYIPLVKSELSEALGYIENGPPRVDEHGMRVEAGKNFLSKLSFGLNMQPNLGRDFFGIGFVRQLFGRPTFTVSFNADKYHASSEVLAGLIINCQNNVCDQSLGRPTDGLLDVVLIPKLSRAQLFTHRKNILDGCFEKIPGASIVHAESLEITSPSGLPLKIGETEFATTPARIEIKPKALKMIVGRLRKF